MEYATAAELMDSKLIQAHLVNDICDYYSSIPPATDARLMRFSDGRHARVSVSLMSRLSPVWHIALNSRTGFRSYDGVVGMMTLADFELVRDAWVCLLSAKKPTALISLSIPEAIRLLIVLDAYQICPFVVNTLLQSVQERFTMEDCALICADTSLGAIPDVVLDLILPILMECPRALRVENPFLQTLMASRKARAHMDPLGLVWLKRSESRKAMGGWKLAFTGQYTLVPRDARMEVLTDQCFEVNNVFPLDGDLVVCQFEHTIPRGHAGHERLSYVVCVNMATGQLVGGPKRLGGLSHTLAMNGVSFFVQGRSEVLVYERTPKFFRDEGVPLRQTLEFVRKRVEVWTFSTGIANMIAFLADSGVLAVYTHCFVDNLYTEAYHIQIHPGFGVYGGLWLSQTSLVLHSGGAHEMSLQLLDDGELVGAPHDVGPRAYQGEQALPDRLCYRYGRVYFLRDKNLVDQKDGIWVFNAADMTLLHIIKNHTSLTHCLLAAYGSRMLVVPCHMFHHERIRMRLFDPFIGKLVPGFIELPFDPSLAQKVIGLANGSVVVVSRSGRLYVLSRFE